MKLAQRGKRTRPNRAKVYDSQTVPAPVGGLNYRDSLALMKPTDALRLDNLLCRPGYVEVRRGQVATATGFPASVDTLLAFTDSNGATKLFAASGAGIYDATSSGAIGAAVVSGLTSAYWHSVQVGNTGGNYLMCVNGQDTGQIYDGASWAALGFTGLATSSMTQLGVWKRRVWAVEKNSFNAWYGAADAIAGAMTQFPFAGIFQKGGRLVAILNWTVDGGSGADDYLLAVSSMGEVAVYKGTDPTSATTFELVGLYFVGPPIGERFYATLGGDVLLLTAAGLIPFSKYLQSQDKKSVLSDRIQQLISSDTSSYGATQGWEVHVYHDQNFVLLQVPAGALGKRYQYVMNLITGAWSRFLVQSASTWKVLGASLFMGDTSKVNNAWSSGTDNGTAITYVCIPAYSYFKQPAREKIFHLGRCLIKAAQDPLFHSLLLTEFVTDSYFPSWGPRAPEGNLWDVAIWDQARWGLATKYSSSWYSLAGIGYAATQAIYGVSSTVDTQLIALDYTFEVGGLL
jgi:hypothetical protein